jgi:hypothetical protein
VFVESVELVENRRLGNAPFLRVRKSLEMSDFEAYLVAKNAARKEKSAVAAPERDLLRRDYTACLQFAEAISC